MKNLSDKYYHTTPKATLENAIQTGQLCVRILDHFDNEKVVATGKKRYHRAMAENVYQLRYVQTGKTFWITKHTFENKYHEA